MSHINVRRSCRRHVNFDSISIDSVSQASITRPTVSHVWSQYFLTCGTAPAVAAVTTEPVRCVTSNLAPRLPQLPLDSRLSTIFNSIGICLLASSIMPLVWSLTFRLLIVFSMISGWCSACVRVCAYAHVASGALNHLLLTIASFPSIHQFRSHPHSSPRFSNRPQRGKHGPVQNQSGFPTLVRPPILMGLCHLSNQSFDHCD